MGDEHNTKHVRRYRLTRYSPYIHFKRIEVKPKSTEDLVQIIMRGKLLPTSEIFRLLFNRWWYILTANKIVLTVYIGIFIAIINLLISFFIVSQNIYVDTPGEDLSLEVFITPENDKGLSGNIKSLSVTSSRLVDPQDYFSFVVKNWKYRKDVDLFNPDYFVPSIFTGLEGEVTTEETSKMRLGSDILDMQSSVFINIMRQQGVDVPYKQMVKVLTVDYPKNYDGLWNIYPDDNILAINGQSVSDPLDIEIMKSMYKDTEVSLDLEREGVHITVVTEIPEMSVGRVVTFTDADYYTPFSRFANLYTKNIAGRSAGISSALAYYDTYIEDVSQGRKIALTGVLNPDGTVAPIAGVNLKTIQAIKADVDIVFFANDVTYSLGKQGSITFDNYTEAKETLERYDSDITLVGVNTFDDILAYLKNSTSE